mgnify:FL=1
MENLLEFLFYVGLFACLVYGIKETIQKHKEDSQ